MYIPTNHNACNDLMSMDAYNAERKQGRIKFFEGEYRYAYPVIFIDNKPHEDRTYFINKSNATIPANATHLAWYD